jgi:hypothetical protein
MLVKLCVIATYNSSGGAALIRLAARRGEGEKADSARGRHAKRTEEAFRETIKTRQ